MATTKGRFTFRGLKVGQNEMDLLAITNHGNGVALYVEVNVATNAQGWTTHLAL